MLSTIIIHAASEVLDDSTQVGSLVPVGCP